jgi:hypothetical protein
VAPRPGALLNAAPPATPPVPSARSESAALLEESSEVLELYAQDEHLEEAVQELQEEAAAAVLRAEALAVEQAAGADEPNVGPAPLRAPARHLLSGGYLCHRA